MAYKITWHQDAADDLLKLDNKIQKMIIDRIKFNLINEPLSSGKPLKGIFKGLYRYLYGDYWIVYSIDRTAQKIIILRVDHSKGVY